MRYYPACLDVMGRDCLVVGGGAVAYRKACTLLECGARVTAVSPEFSANWDSIADHGDLARIVRPYRSEDVENRFLVVGATNDEALNRRISSDARRRGILCNIADLPEACSFILPSIVNRGDLILTVSTSGKSPAFAKRLRKSLEKDFGEEYTEFLQLMGAIREKLLAAEHAPEAHKPLFEMLIDKGLLEMIRDRQIDGIDRLLEEVLGAGYDYHGLMQSAENDSDAGEK